MGKAKETVRTFADGSKASVLELTTAFGGLRDILSAVGISLSIAGLVGFIRSTIESAEQTTNFARQLRIGTDELQALEAEAAKSGIDLGSLRTHLDRLEVAAGNATNGQREIQKAFVETGVSFDTFSGKARAPLDILVDLAKGYATAKDQTAYMAAATKIMGRNASELVPLLEALARDGIRGLVEEQTKLGQVTAPEKLAEISQGMTKLGESWHRVTVGAQSDIAGFFEIIEKTKTQLEDFGKTEVGKNLDDLGAGIDGVAAHFKTFFDDLDKAHSFDDMKKTAGTMWEGIVADSTKAGTSIVDLASQVRDGWVIAFDKIGEAGTPAWKALEVGAIAGTAKIAEFATSMSEKAVTALEEFGTKAGEIWNGIVGDIQGGINAMLRFLGLQGKGELDSNLDQINTLSDKVTELQKKLETGGTSVGPLGQNFLPFTPEEIAALKTEIENLNAAIDQLMLRRDELQSGATKSSYSGGGGGGLIGVNFRGMVLGGSGTSTLTGGSGTDTLGNGARPPYVTPPEKTSKERLSAVEALSRAFEEQAKEAGVASLALSDQALALEKIQAQYKLTNAVLIDFHANLRKTKEPTDAERLAVDKMVESLHRVDRVSAIDNMTKAMNEQAAEMETAAANTKDHGLALDKLQAEYKLTTAALADYTANMRATKDPTAQEILDVDALATKLNVLKVAAAAAADMKEGITNLAAGFKDLGAGVIAAAGNFQSWKDFGTDAIQTVFNLIFDQLTRLSQFGGAGGSIFQNLADMLFGSSITAGAGGGKGYAGGGSFIVGGVGGADSQLVQFRATPGEPVTVGRPGSGGANVLVQVINNTGQQTTTEHSKGQDGQKIVKITVGDAFARDLRERGTAAQALEATYGLQRKGYG